MDSLLSIAERRQHAYDDAVASAPPPPSPRPSPPGKGRRKKPQNDATAKGKPDASQPAADEVEARILESLANPAHRPLTIEDRCEILGIARSTWYRHTADPLFRSRTAHAFRHAVSDTLGPVLDVLATSALLEGQDGHQDRKLYLQLAGVVESDPARRRGDEPDDPAKPKLPGQQLTDAELHGALEGVERIWYPVGWRRRAGDDPDAGKTNGDGTDK